MSGEPNRAARAFVYLSRPMRTRRLLAPLVLLAPLAAATQASAAEVSVGVVNFRFEPKTVQIQPGDTVAWNFETDGHTSTSDQGEPERWNSGGVAAGQAFRHTFSKPGRFSYVCIPHEISGMTGVVQVGTDEFPRSQTRFRQRRRGSTLTFSFRLVEPAKVTVRLRGASRRKVTRRRLGTGGHSIRLARLREGRYRGSVTFVDDFDNKSVVRTSAVIR
jgi:plastocyanin